MRNANASPIPAANNAPKPPIRYNASELWTRNSNQQHHLPPNVLDAINEANKITTRKSKHQKLRWRKRNNYKKSKAPEITTTLPSIVNTNCRSICNKKENLWQILNDNKDDIIFLTETWTNDANEVITTNEISQSNPDYEIVYKSRSIAVYIPPDSKNVMDKSPARQSHHRSSTQRSRNMHPANLRRRRLQWRRHIRNMQKPRTISNQQKTNSEK